MLEQSLDNTTQGRSRKLEDKVDVFTGPARSIEEGIVLLFFKEGAKVAITDRDKPNNASAEEIQGDDEITKIVEGIINLVGIHK
ncbi:MAG: hypothetical protein MUO43_06775 [Desulfobacterales bacterium]|nr:hypothetical protein [Desulfobacterales bacterium]